MPFVPILIGIAVSVGLGLVSRLLTPKPKNINGPSTRELTINEPDAPWQIVYGERVVGGSLFAIELAGSNSEFLYLGIVWCYGGPDGIEDIADIRFGDEVAVNGTTPIAKYSGLITVEHHLGTDSQTASTLLTGLSGSRFGSNDKGSGHAYSVIKLKWDENKFSDFSIEQIRARIKGRKVLDTRTGLVAYSKNPVMCLRDYLSNTRFGLGYGQSPRTLPVIMDDTFNEDQADICDALVSRKAGGTRTQFALNLAFTTDNEPGKSSQLMLEAMAGGLSYANGKWRIHAGAWSAPVKTLTDDDLRGPIEMTIGMGRLDTFNAVRGEFMDPTTWQPTNYPPYGPASVLAEDGGIRIWLDMDLGGVTDPGQAQQLAKIALEQARRPVQLKLPCKFLAYEVAAGDRIAFTHGNWTAKTFRVQRVAAGGQQDEQGGIVLGADLFCAEDDSTAWDWNAATDEGDYATPSSANLPNMTTVQPATSLAVAAYDSVAPDGSHQLAAKLTWTSPADQFVISGGKLHVYFKKHSDSTYTQATVLAGDQTETVIHGILSGTSYDYKVVAENAARVLSADAILSNQTLTISLSGMLTYRPLTNPLTAHDAGSNVTINAASFTMRVQGVGDKSINSGALTGKSYNTLYFVYYDDATLAGGSVTYGASTVKEDAINGAGRFFVGSILTPRAGAPDTAGNSDGGSGAQNGRITRLYMSQASSFADHSATITNPQNAFDGDLTTKATLTCPGNSQDNSVNLTLTVPPGFSRGVGSATLFVRRAIPTANLSGSTGTVYTAIYFVQGSGSFTTMENASQNTTLALGTQSYALPDNINLATLKVIFALTGGIAFTGGSMVLDLYEVWIEVVE